MARNRANTRGTAHSYPRGTLSVMRGGYGFVQTAEGEFFIPAGKMNGAFDGDVVEISPVRQERSRKALARAAAQAASGTQKREARVKRVLEHAHAEIVGRFEIAEPFGVVVPEDPRIPYDVFTLLSENSGVPDGAIVRVAITTYPSRKEAATGVVVEVLGDDDDERLPIDLIVARHKLETQFSQGALDEAADARVNAEGALVEGYRDLRERFVFTIDPDDARDFDDAVSLEWVDGAAGMSDVDGGCLPGVGSGTGGCAQKLDPLCREKLVDDRRSLRSTPRPRADASWNPGEEVDAVDGGCLPGDGGGAGGCAQKLAPLDNEKLVDDRRGLRCISCSSAIASWDPGEDAIASPSSGNSAVLSKGACWRLGVHIADVAHYVPWGSSVDLDARRRATSVYLVDRVIPMLPEALSNDVCSLKPGEVRRTMTVDMLLDEAGNVLDVDVYPALIRSCARLTYDQAQRMVQKGQILSHHSIDSEDAEGLAWRIRELSAIAKKRAALRERSGGLDFDTTEAKVRLDDRGVPIGVELRERTDATQLIEEAMIAANEAVARFLGDAGFPCIYRVHEKPSRESLSGLVPVLQEFNWFKGIDVDAFVAGNPLVVGEVLARCEGRSEDVLVTTLVLRAMKRAVYEPELAGHYALASEAYCHFTSPIRRYPDLVVHRMLKAALGGRPGKFDQEVSNMPWIAEHSSEMERVAERAARESQECKLVELMETRVGEVFSAIITGVAPYGLFVRLENTAEGMVPIGDLGREYFALDSVRHTLTGSDTGKEYRLGRHVAVRLVEADRRTRTLRFRLCDKRGQTPFVTD